MEEIRSMLLAANRFLVTSHSRPDGDAVGSVLAFAEMLDQLGKQADCVLADPVPQVYMKLPGVERIRQSAAVNAAAYDVAVILECDAKQRTGIAGYGDLPILNIDHHLTGCEYGTLNWIDGDVFAVAVLVYQLALRMNVTITPAMATCLYTAVFTDTGAFTYPGTAVATLPLAQKLIALGADADGVAHSVLYSVSAGSIRLLGTALSRMQLRGVTAWSYILQDDLLKLGASEEDSEGTVNYLVSIAGVHAALFLREMPSEGIGKPAKFRASLRSKSMVDVSAIATQFGGGGHRNAAGCMVAGRLDEVAQRILNEMERGHAITPATPSCSV